jgi:nicotinamidase-related amidase
MPRTHLLLIDPQNDFCDLPASACPPGQSPARMRICSAWPS